MLQKKQNCILCESPQTKVYCEITRPQKTYLVCPVCNLIFLLPEFYVSLEAEKEKYDQHQNSPDQQGYVDFLNNLLTPLSLLLPKNSFGLDFGSGPGPAIQTILAREGHKVLNYDKTYCTSPEPLKNKYDFITCTEVIEHFHHPRKEFEQLYSMLKNNQSYLGIMTQTLPENTNFKDWWYHRDPTHVCFFSKRTFLWIAEWLGLEVNFFEKYTVIFTKKIPGPRN